VLFHDVACGCFEDVHCLALSCCCCHVSHYIYIIDIIQAHSLVIPELSQNSCKSLARKELRRRAAPPRPKSLCHNHLRHNLIQSKIKTELATNGHISGFLCDGDLAR
jgi:hypothetical protein